MGAVALTMKLIYSHCLIRFNISSEKNDFGFNSIQKINFSNNFTFKCNQKHLTLMLSRSRSTSDHHLNKLGRPNIQNVTYQVPRSSAFWFWRFLKGFYHIWACRPSWSSDQNNLYKSWLTYCKESSYEIWVQLGKWFVRKLCFNILMGLQYERLGWKVKGQPWPLELIYSHCPIRLNISSENNDIGFSSFQEINFPKISPFKCIRKQI